MTKYSSKLGQVKGKVNWGIEEKPMGSYMSFLMVIFLSFLSHMCTTWLNGISAEEYY
jgi:hypothetical protein